MDSERLEMIYGGTDGTVDGDGEPSVCRSLRKSVHSFAVDVYDVDVDARSFQGRRTGRPTRNAVHLFVPNECCSQAPAGLVSSVVRGTFEFGVEKRIST